MVQAYYRARHTETAIKARIKNDPSSSARTNAAQSSVETRDKQMVNADTFSKSKSGMGENFDKSKGKASRTPTSSLEPPETDLSYLMGLIKNTVEGMNVDACDEVTKISVKQWLQAEVHDLQKTIIQSRKRELEAEDVLQKTITEIDNSKKEREQIWNNFTRILSYPHLLDDRDLALFVVRNRGDWLGLLSERLRDDPAVVLAAMSDCHPHGSYGRRFPEVSSVFAMASDRLRNDVEFVLKMLKRIHSKSDRSKLIASLEEKIKKHPEIKKCIKNGRSLFSLSDLLRDFDDSIILVEPEGARERVQELPIEPITYPEIRNEFSAYIGASSQVAQLLETVQDLKQTVADSSKTQLEAVRDLKNMIIERDNEGKAIGNFNANFRSDSPIVVCYPQILDDENTGWKLVSKNGKYLNKLSARLRDNSWVVAAAFRSVTRSRTRSNKSNVCDVSWYGSVFAMASDRLRNDVDFAVSMIMNIPKRSWRRAFIKTLGVNMQSNPKIKACLKGYF